MSFTNQRLSALTSEPTRMQRVLSLAVKMQYWLIMLIAVAAAVYYHFRPLPGNEVALQKIAALTKENAQLQTRHDRLSRRITWLKDKDTLFLETAATDLLGWQREGQVIMRLPPSTRP